MPSMDNFNDLVHAEMKKSAVKVLKTHPRDIVERTLYAVGRVFVSVDPEEDTPEAKRAVAAEMLENIAAALRSDDNPLGVDYTTDKDGNYTGEVNFTVGTAVASDSILPEALLERSYSNRVKSAAKKFVQ